MSSQALWRPINTAEMIPNQFLRSLYKWVQPTVENWMGFGELAKIYAGSMCKGEASPVEFAENVLKYLNVDVEYDEALLDAVDRLEGSVVFAANHPYGCIDAMAFMVMMDRSKPGSWKIFANQLLRSIPDLRKGLIDVNPFAKDDERKQNVKAMRAAMTHLNEGGAVGMFPARRVSSWSDELDAICDYPWTDHAVKIAAKTNSAILTVHIDGQNSEKFLKIPSTKLMRRSLALAKEVPRQKDRTVTLSLGKYFDPNEVAQLVKQKNAAQKLIASCYAGAEKQQAQKAKSESGEVKTDFPVDLSAHVAALTREHTLEASDEFGLYLFQGHEAPELLEEIGRCREITFQQIGAGSGNVIDVAKEDEYYHHLLLWDKVNSNLVGAYRIGFIQEIIQEHGTSGVYLDHVFKFDPSFYESLGGAMELSRSFILPDYQKNPKVLDLLWKGLGQAANLKQCYTMFGSVTISAAFTPLSQAVLVDTLDRFHSDTPELRSKVESKYPFKPKTRYHSLTADAWEKDGINRLNAVIEEFEEGERSIPPLVRYYIALGAKFLSFNVEPTFNDAIYCLLKVDLKKMPVRYRKRFLGE